METINQVSLQGRLYSDATLKTFSNGGGIVKLTVVTEFSYMDKKQDKQVTYPEYHDVIVKGAKVREAEHFRKGDMVTLTGRLKKRTYDFQGQKRYAVEVHTFDVGIAGQNPGSVQDHEEEINGNVW